MRRFAIGMVLMLIVGSSSGQAVAQLRSFQPGEVLRADDLNAIVELLNSLTSSPGDVAGTWVGTLTAEGGDTFATRLTLLQSPGLSHFTGSAAYCAPAPCEPPVTTMATFTGHVIQGPFFALFPVLTSTGPCAPGSFNVTGTLNEARDQMTMTGGGRNDDCRVGAFTGTFAKESLGLPVTVIINAPTQSQVFADGSSIAFQARALDAIGHEVSGASLVWLSDRDGQIGTGDAFTRSDLSRGTHRITVITTNIDITVSSLSATCLENLIIDGSPDITIHQLQGSTCVGSCRQELAERLEEAGVPSFSGACCSAPGPTACIGFTPASRGTMEGAQCLVDLLGPPYRVDATCASSFAAYQINLE